MRTTSYGGYKRGFLKPGMSEKAWRKVAIQYQQLFYEIFDHKKYPMKIRGTMAHEFTIQVLLEDLSEAILGTKASILIDLKESYDLDYYKALLLVLKTSRR